jgi:hypothetical protein
MATKITQNGSHEDHKGHEGDLARNRYRTIVSFVPFVANNFVARRD